MVMYNGEREKLFSDKLNKNEFAKRAIPKLLSFSWKNSTGQGYAAVLYFDEKTIIDAFKELEKEYSNDQIELKFIVNHSNNHVNVKLICRDKELFVNKGIKQEVFKADF